MTLSKTSFFSESCVRLIMSYIVKTNFKENATKLRNINGAQSFISSVLQDTDLHLMVL